MTDEPDDDEEAEDAHVSPAIEAAAAKKIEAQRRKAAATREARVRLARKNFGAFCELVMRDERTNEPIILATHHWVWCRLMDEQDRLVILSAIELGKTNLFAIARTLYELGQDPTLRFLILGNTKDLAKKIAGPIKRYIERSDELHAVFPHLQPGEPWGEYSFNIRGNRSAKDPSIQVAGVHGNIQGARLDRIVADDIVDFENSRTQAARQDLIDWWPTVIGRGTADCKIRVVGNPWHHRDIYHHLARQWRAEHGDECAQSFPVVTADGLPRWPERWPEARIAAKAKDLGPVEAQRQLMCMVHDDATSRFPEAAIRLALTLGEGKSVCSALSVVPRGYKTYTGVDLAIQQHAKAGKCAFSTIAVDPYGVREILNVEAGRYPGPVIVQKIIDCHLRYSSIMVVENNAAQDWIIQFTRERVSIPIIPFTTGRNKAHPEFGIESIAAEMAGQKWRIPNTNGMCAPEVAMLLDEMRFYDPAAHTGDRLMSLYFAREGARKGKMTPGTVRNFDTVRR